MRGSTWIDSAETAIPPGLQKIAVSRQRLTGVVLLAMAAIGCRMFGSSPIRSPLSYQQEVKEIEKLVPKGTPREETVSRLKQAGIVGEYSPAGQSIYHCLLWNRPEGERWHLHVALLFDEHDRFYAVQPSDTTVRRDYSTEDGSVDQTASDSGKRSAPSFPQSAAKDANAGKIIPWPIGSETDNSADGSRTSGTSTTAADSSLPSSGRSGRRSPFGEFSP